MKDEVRRISKLVAEGRLTPEDAADLIDAFYSGMSESEREEEREADQQTPPQPNAEHAHGAVKDPFKAFVESVEKLTKEGIDSVNWSEVSIQARTFGKKGLDAVRIGLDELSKGKVNLNWLRSHEIKEVTMPLSIPAGKTLRVENPNGTVKVVGGFDTGTVVATAKIRGATPEDARAKAETYSLVFEESDGWVVLRQPDMSGLTVDIEVQMAGNGAVEIRGESGDIQVLDTKGSCKVATRSGGVRVRGLNGAIELATESGDISVEDSTSQMVVAENKSGDIKIRNTIGNMNLRTQSGDVAIRTSSGKVISIETVAGNIDIDSEVSVTGSINVRTVNGNTLLAVGDGCDCRVSLSTLRGSVKSSVELTDERSTDQRITGRLGSGNGTIDVSAVMGNITFEIRDAVTA